MEELRRLEQVQSTLTFMQSRGFVASSCKNNQDSNRFLANLILLLVQPCGELNIEDKCRLISQNLPNLSVSFLEEASVWVSQGGCQQNRVGSYVIKENEHDWLQNDYDGTPMVGFDAMQRANSTLEDFCRSYFMFHGMDGKSPQAIFKYLPVLSFTESYVYQLDRLNEKILDGQNVGATGGSEEVNQNQVSKLTNVFKIDPFRPLVSLLEHHGLLTERIREELRCGEEYWALERKLCCALKSKKQVSIENVMRAIHLKSFDYRVLHLLLYQLRREKVPFKMFIQIPERLFLLSFHFFRCFKFVLKATMKVNDLHMEFLSISEFLVEISDDLFDYEDDVLENNFNILRMFVRIYGPSTAPAMLAKCITETEEKYQTMLKSLEPQLAVKYERRCEEATKEGGMISGHCFGTWNIPPVIVDEELHQSNMLNLK